MFFASLYFLLNKIVTVLQKLHMPLQRFLATERNFLMRAEEANY